MATIATTRVRRNGAIRWIDSSVPVRNRQSTTIIHLGLVCGLAVTFGAGCARTAWAPHLSQLYDRSAQDYGVDRNPIIVIPGVMGSRLKDAESGRVVWGAFTGGSINPRTTRGARLVALPMREGAALSELTDHVVPDGALETLTLSLFGIPITLNAYAHILRALGTGGYRDQQLAEAGAINYGEGHFTCFQFDYDWRRDLSENAGLLHAYILEKRAYVEQELARRFGITDAQVKFDLVGHSMGGLLARYYARYGGEGLPEDGSVPPVTWAGSEYVERVVLIGTPNGGAIEALYDAVKGFKLGPFLPRYEPAVLGTMPALYELLPHPEHRMVVDAANPEQALDVYDPALWDRVSWGLLSPKQDQVLKKLLPEAKDREARRRIALDHVRKSLRRGRQFAEALDQDVPPPEGLSLHLFAGDAVPTYATVAVDLETGRLEVIREAPGDGSVTRSSALKDTREGGEWSRQLVSPIQWKNIMFLFTDHMGMTKDPAFIDNILFFLLERPS